MKTCAELEERAGLLVRLPRGHVERLTAEAHARGCASCADTWRGAEDLDAALDVLGDLAPPTEDALMRTSSAVLAELDGGVIARSRPPHRWLSRAASPAAVLLVFGLLVLSWRHPASDGSVWLRALLVLAFAAALSSVTARRGMAVGAALALSLLHAATVGAGLRVQSAVGAHCLVIELGAALVPFAVLGALAWRRGRAPVLGAFALAAATGALGAEAALDLGCAAHLDVPHALLFHSGGVLLALLATLAAHAFVATRGLARRG